MPMSLESRGANRSENIRSLGPDPKENVIGSHNSSHLRAFGEDTTMRLPILLASLVIAEMAHAQIALGAHVLTVDDRITLRKTVALGATVEFRSPWIPAAGWRAGVFVSPFANEHSEVKGSSDEPEPHTWKAFQRDERIASVGLAMDLKFPFSDTSCIGGLYRGAYTTFGAGWVQRWRQRDLRWETSEGLVTKAVERESWGDLLLRAGFGGEWNFTWGCPFVEGQISAAISGEGAKVFRFPSTIGVVAGFRYVLKSN